MTGALIARIGADESVRHGVCCVLPAVQRNGTFTRQLIARERLEGAKHRAQIDRRGCQSDCY